jgi:hypothetical protein
VLVKPKTDPDNLFQWIYNDADIDASPVVWARDMHVEANQGLPSYYHGPQDLARGSPNAVQPH